VLRWRTAMLLPFLLLVACGSPPTLRTTALDDGAITVASFNFSESVLLAELYGQALRSAGFRVELALDLGARELVQPALQKGLVELVPEYAGSALEFVAGGGSASADERATHRALAGAMASRLPSWVARRSTSSQAPAPRSARSSMRVVAICFGPLPCRLRSASRAAAKSRSSSASSARVTREALWARSPEASARSSQRSRR